MRLRQLASNSFQLSEPGRAPSLVRFALPLPVIIEGDVGLPTCEHLLSAVNCCWRGRPRSTNITRIRLGLDGARPSRRAEACLRARLAFSRSIGSGLFRRTCAALAGLVGRAGLPCNPSTRIQDKVSSICDYVCGALRHDAKGNKRKIPNHAQKKSALPLLREIMCAQHRKGDPGPIKPVEFRQAAPDHLHVPRSPASFRFANGGLQQLDGALGSP